MADAPDDATSGSEPGAAGLSRRRTSDKRRRALERSSGLHWAGTVLGGAGLSYLELASVQLASAEMYAEEIGVVSSWPYLLLARSAADAEVESMAAPWMNRLCLEDHYDSRGERFAASFPFYHQIFEKRGHSSLQGRGGP